MRAGAVTRANLMAASTASAPELQKNTRSMLGGLRADELFGQQSRQEGAVHLDHVGQVGVDRLVQGVFDRLG